MVFLFHYLARFDHGRWCRFVSSTILPLYGLNKWCKVGQLLLYVRMIGGLGVPSTVIRKDYHLSCDKSHLSWKGLSKSDIKRIRKFGYPDRFGQVMVWTVPWDQDADSLKQASSWSKSKEACLSNSVRQSCRLKRASTVQKMPTAVQYHLTSFYLCAYIHFVLRELCLCHLRLCCIYRDCQRST